MLLTVDIAGEPILLPVDRAAILRGQLATIDLAHIALFPIERAFLGLQPRGLPGGELTALDTPPDAVLLIVAVLSQAELIALAGKGRALGLDMLCEAHNEEELRRSASGTLGGP